MPFPAASIYGFASTKRFIVDREIGRGGMGVVYEAQDLERNTRVALKALTASNALNIYRLKNEFRQLADLSHPNLVALHELCNEAGSWFFTMELVGGLPFDRYIASTGKAVSLPPERWTVATRPSRRPTDASITLNQRAIGSAFPLARPSYDLARLLKALTQLVEAVNALHMAGKLHRDLKPSNVLVTPEGRVVVLDFGLVSNGTLIDAGQQDADRTMGGCLFGTPAYMSPEQAASRTVTPASDWYAVGAMLYEVLTGELPFEGSVLDILRQKEESEPVPPSELVGDVPPNLDKLCRGLLRRDPERRPSCSEIMALLGGEETRLRFSEAPASRANELPIELFLGRKEHLKALREAFAETQAGKPITLLVHGTSGMGKTALVRDFANDLIRNDQAVVLRGRCYERESVPYKAFDNIIDALSRYLMRLPAEEAAALLPRNIQALSILFPVLKRVKPIAEARKPLHQTDDARELRNQAFGALKDLLLRITDFHPLVITIDDLQWADMDSARLLGFLMSPPDPPPLLLIGTYRRDEAASSAFLQCVRTEQRLGEGAAILRELALDALSETEAQELAAILLRGVPAATPRFANAIAAEAAGVPFFIAELVQHHKAQSAHGELPDALLPISLDQVIHARISRMPENAQRLLQVLSVAAGPIEQSVAIEAAGLPRGDRAATLTLRAARLIRTRGVRHGDAAETYHDRVRETVVRNMDTATVRDTHARIARALERNDVTDAERLVAHYSGAGDGTRAGETALEAAQVAEQKLAFNRAAELYRRAIELLGGNDGQQPLYEKLGSALANAGKGAKAAEAYLRAAEGTQIANARRLQRLAAQQYLRSGRIEEGKKLARELMRAVGTDLPASGPRGIVQYIGARAKLSLARLGSPRPANTISALALERVELFGAFFRELSVPEPLTSAILGSRYLRDAIRANQSAHVLQAMSWEIVNVAILGGAKNRKRAKALLEQLEPMTDATGDAFWSATYDTAAATHLVMSGQFSEAIDVAARAERTYRDQCTGAIWETCFVSMLHYASLEFCGPLNGIRQHAAERARDAAERDDWYSLGLLLLCIPCAALMEDRPADAMDYLRKETARMGPDYNAFRNMAVIRTVDTLIYEGRGTEALAYVMEHWDRARSSYVYRSVFQASALHCLRARAALCAHAEQRDPALLRLVASDLRTLRSLDCGYADLATALEAVLVFRQGQTDQARSLLVKSAEQFELRGMHILSLYARRRLSEIAAPGTDQALLVDAVDQELRAQGVRDPARWSSIHLPYL